MRLVGLDGAERAVLLERADINGVAASPDGQKVAVAYGIPFAVVVFDIATGTELLCVVAGSGAGVGGAQGGRAAPSVSLAMLPGPGVVRAGRLEHRERRGEHRRALVIHVGEPSCIRTTDASRSWISTGARRCCRRGCCSRRVSGT